MHRTTRRSLTALGCATTGLATMLAPAPAHAADAVNLVVNAGDPITIQGNCMSPPFDVKVTDNQIVVARARWELTCADGQITMTGWVDDVRSDGKCAYVRGEFSNGTELAKDCPADGPREEFKWTHPGNIANGFAFVS